MLDFWLSPIGRGEGTEKIDPLRETEEEDLENADEEYSSIL